MGSRLRNTRARPIVKYPGIPRIVVPGYSFGRRGSSRNRYPTRPHACLQSDFGRFVAISSWTTNRRRDLEEARASPVDFNIVFALFSTIILDSPPASVLGEPSLRGIRLLYITG